MAVGKMTELEAVNTMLTTIGDSPIASLASTGSAYVAIAQSTLNEVSRQVQADGWHFNTEYSYALALSVDGTIPVPSNTLRVDASQSHTDVNIVERGGLLYNLDDHTNIFTEAQYVDIVFGFDWDYLPQHFRQYIALRAARVFQARVLGDETIAKNITMAEREAKAALEDADAENGDVTMLNGSWSVYRVIAR